MKIKKHKLQIIVMALSLVVTFQAIYIVDFLKNEQIKSQQQVQQFSQEVLTQAQQEGQNFIDQQAEIKGAKLKLVKNPDSDQVEIWLEASNLLELVEVKLNYDPDNLQITDQVSNKNGTQIAWGQAQTYLENQVDAQTGQIVLTAQFKDGFEGKVLLGQIIYHQIKSPTQISFEYLPKSFEGSFVKDLDSGENILEKPETLMIRRIENFRIENK